MIEDFNDKSQPENDIRIHFNEELLVVHNLDIKGARKAEQDDFDYAIDFNEIYRPLEGSRAFTRRLD